MFAATPAARPLRCRRLIFAARQEYGKRCKYVTPQHARGKEVRQARARADAYRITLRSIARGGSERKA